MDVDPSKKGTDMAKIEFIQEKTETRPGSVERIEVRPWGLGGTVRQEFLIGSGGNAHATFNVLVEIIYTVNGFQLFYTRDYLMFYGEAESAMAVGQHLEKFKQGDVDAIGFGDMLPATSILLKRRKSTYQDQNDQEAISEDYQLEVSSDVGAVFGHESPGVRMINIQLEEIEAENGIRFMEELIQEIVDAHCGKRPNPADLPEGASDWPFARQLNQKAYDLISEDYDEGYFANPLLTGMFDSWLEQLPPGSHILDAGCGHGEPVISRLLEKGCRVTGTDLSPRMLERARKSFPSVTFVNQMVGDIRSEAEYDGAVSFSSLLYLDPIDLSHSLYRLYKAIKPGGLLFLFVYDLHPSWRGLPYDDQINQWMWSWCHGMDDATQALEEFGYFKVLNVQNVTTEEEKERKIASWRKYTQEQYERLVESYPLAAENPPDLSKVPQNISYCYAMIAQRV
jgi:SAM-dependent methyltransferase